MKVDLLNASALLLALTLATLGAGLGSAEQTSRAPQPSTASEVVVEDLPSGGRALRDARGVLVPLLDYQRIASGTLVADRVLVDLCEPTRLVAFSRHAAKTPSGFRYAGKPTLGARDDVERVLALKPDLLIHSDRVEPSYIARLEEHGIRVFVLRPMLGLRSLLLDIRALGLLTGHAARAETYASALQSRLENVARDVTEPTRSRALYLSIYGAKLFASGSDTSYHDVIRYAGLSDATSAANLRGWPELSSEQVLALDPDVLITRTGMRDVLCRHAGLALLRPCRAGGHLIELDGALLDDPGPAMLEAAEALHDAWLLRARGDGRASTPR